MSNYYEQLARLLVSLLVALLALFGTSADPTSTTSTTIPELVYRSPCHEDENWNVIDYRTIGALEDASGVSRLCVHYDETTN